MEIDQSCLNEAVLGIVRGGVFLYIYILMENDCRYGSGH